VDELYLPSFQLDDILVFQWHTQDISVGFMRDFV